MVPENQGTSPRLQTNTTAEPIVEITFLTTNPVSFPSAIPLPTQNYLKKAKLIFAFQNHSRILQVKRPDFFFHLLFVFASPGPVNKEKVNHVHLNIFKDKDTV